MSAMAFTFTIARNLHLPPRATLPSLSFPTRDYSAGQPKVTNYVAGRGVT